MYDSVLYYIEKIKNMVFDLNFSIPGNYYLATVHRPQNTDYKEKIKSIFSAFSKLDYPVILPLHPRTKKVVQKYKIETKNVKIIEPVGYLQLMYLLSRANKVLTDSGGLQKEAYFLSKQCITLRTETEWTETLINNWNQIVGADEEKIINAVNSKITGKKGDYFGEGNTANSILKILADHC